MRRTGAPLIATMAAALALAGCGVGDATFSVRDSLAELPRAAAANPQRMLVVVGDVARAEELAGVESPDGDAPGGEWTLALSGREDFALAFPEQLQVQRTGVREVLGFDARDVDTFAAIDSATGITVVELADGAELREDVTTTGPGTPGQIDREADASGAFPVVLGVRSDGDRVALAGTSAALGAWGSGTSLQDDPDLGSIADALDGRDVYTALLQRGPASGDRGAPPRAAEVAMPAFTAVGVGHTFADGEPTVTVAYAVDDPEGARDQIAAVWSEGASLRTGRPLRELATVRAVTVEEESLVVVELVPSAPVPQFNQMLRAADLPFVAS